MKLIAAALLMSALPAAADTTFRSVALSLDGQRLEYTTSAGVTASAPKLGDQVAFSSARVSKSGRFLGWLALHPNCCTSYPIPLALVVLGSDLKLHEFQGSQATFDWCFGEKDTAVVYRRALLHGPSPDMYELRRIEDGKLLRAFEVSIDAPAHETQASHLPAWARCAAP